jgi:F-type H+-transporting ATPase subunit delta
MKNTRVARRYAQALMLSADSAMSMIDAIAGDLELIKRTLDGSRELRLLLASPVVKSDKKRAVLRELFRSRIGAVTMTFVELLTEKQREGMLSEVIEQFGALRDAKYGIVNVDVASAVEISEQQERSLSAKLEAYTKKKVRLRFALDASLKGGMVVRIGDTVLDASVKRQLEVIRERFVEGHALN